MSTSFARPTLPELLGRIDAELSSRLGVGPPLRHSVLGVIARVLAGSSHMLHGHLDWAATQLFPDTADQEQLDQWARVWQVQRRTATYAAGPAKAYGSSGITIPAGTLFQRADGAEFLTQGDEVIDGGKATVTLQAVVPGAAGDCPDGTVLTLVSPIDGVQSDAIVDPEGVAGGEDSETDAELRARILARIARPPHGGALHDYEAWTLAVPGIQRAWIRPHHMGLGTVGISFTVDEDGTIIPDAAKIAEVEAYIGALRPVTADVWVFAPTAVPLAFEIQLPAPNAAAQAAIETALQEFLLREADLGGTIHLSRISEVISTSPGETSHVLVQPAADVTVQAGELSTFGGVTWS